MTGHIDLDPGCPAYGGRADRPARLLRWQGRGSRNVLVVPVDGGPPNVRPFARPRSAT